MRNNAMRNNVVQRGRGYSFVVGVRDPETGRPRQKWVSGFTSRREAEKAAREALHRLDVGQDPFERITVVDFYDRWLAHLDRQDKPRPRTRHEYARLVRQRIVPAIGGLELARVRPAHLQAIIDATAAEGVKPAALRAVLSTSFEAALRWQLIPVNVARATTAPSKARPALTVPSAQQLRELIDAAVGDTWEIPVMLAATTGARRAEVLGVHWRDVDLDRGRLRVDMTVQRIGGELQFVPPKTEKARRSIPLPGFAVERLRAHKADQARRRLAFGGEWRDVDLVCDRGDGGPHDPDSFSHGFARLAKSVGLEGARLHDCRHGVATALAASGARPEVTSAILGHSSPSFTQSVYTHPDGEQLEAAMRSVEAAFGR